MTGSNITNGALWLTLSKKILINVFPGCTADKWNTLDITHSIAPADPVPCGTEVQVQCKDTYSSTSKVKCEDGAFTYSGDKPECQSGIFRFTVTPMIRPSSPCAPPHSLRGVPMQLYCICRARSGVARMDC